MSINTNEGTCRCNMSQLDFLVCGHVIILSLLSCHWDKYLSTLTFPHCQNQEEIKSQKLK